MKKSNWPTISRHARGYDGRWDKLRKLVLQRDHGLCQCSRCQGGSIRVMQATEVHHIKPKSEGGTDDMGNLQAIHKDCHKRETAKQQGRILNPKPTIGLDGYPIDREGGM